MSSATTTQIHPDAERVQFADTSDDAWWTIRARDDRFTILTRWGREGKLRYTIVDHELGVRGPCDLIGQGWDFSKATAAEDAAKLLRALRYHLEVGARLAAGEKSVTLEEISTAVSERNNLPIRIKTWR